MPPNNSLTTCNSRYVTPLLCPDYPEKLCAQYPVPLPAFHSRKRPHNAVDNWGGPQHTIVIRPSLDEEEEIFTRTRPSTDNLDAITDVSLH